MNRHVQTAARTANRAWVTSTLRQRNIDREANRAVGPRRQLPHTVLTTCWPHAAGSWPGLLGWRAARWPWNALRFVAGVLWPRSWTGRQHRWFNRVGRLTWTVAGFGLLLVATALIALGLVVAGAGWLIANVAGFAAVARGWSPPMAFETIPAADLDTDRALFTEADEHTRRHRQSPGAAAATPDRWDDDNLQDPYLAVQREGTRELARHNDLLEQQPTPHQAGPQSTAQPTAASLPTYYYEARLRQPWAARAAIWLFAASTIVGCLFFLTAIVFSLWSANGGPQPPTTDELITQIHQRTEARSQQRADDLWSKHGGTP